MAGASDSAKKTNKQKNAFGKPGVSCKMVKKTKKQKQK